MYKDLFYNEQIFVKKVTFLQKKAKNGKIFGIIHTFPLVKCIIYLENLQKTYEQ